VKSITTRILISEELVVEVARDDDCLPLICPPWGPAPHKADGVKGCRRLSRLASSEWGLTDGDDHMAGGLGPSSPRRQHRNWDGSPLPLCLSP
jgi:hypothetical protein